MLVSGKKLWCPLLFPHLRTGFYECPTDCSTEEEEDDNEDGSCRCSCPDLDSKIESGEWRDLIVDALDVDDLREEVQALPDEAQVRSEVNIFVFSGLFLLTQLLSISHQIAFLREVCNAGILIGDHLEAASAYDPSFWPIHPTLERLWQVSLLSFFPFDCTPVSLLRLLPFFPPTCTQWKKLNNKFDSEDWPSLSISIYGDGCSGHAQDDVIPLSDLIVPGMNLTNR